MATAGRAEGTSGTWLDPHGPKTVLLALKEREEPETEKDPRGLYPYTAAKNLGYVELGREKSPANGE